MNVPIGILVIIGAFLTVPETRAKITVPGLDVVGLLLSAIGFGALIFALIEGQTIGWWKPIADLHVFGATWPSTAPISATPVVAAVGVVALVGFVLWERHRARIRYSAILDLGLFRFHTFSWGNCTAMAVAIGEFGLLLVLPLFLVNAYGLSTLGAGYVLAVMALGAFASGAAARHVTARFGAPRTVMLGLALEVVGVLAFALYLRPSSAAWLLALLLAIYGLGLGLASAQLTGTVLVDIPTSESGQGSATQSTVRQLGAALGTAILGTVLSLGLAHALTDRLEPVALPPQVESGLVDSTRDSAGGTIPPIREQGDHGRLGPAGPETADALSEGFADATRWSLFVAAGFLAVGLATATRYSTDARRTTTPRPPPRRRRRVGEAPSGERRTWLRAGRSLVGGREDLPQQHGGGDTERARHPERRRQQERSCQRQRHRDDQYRQHRDPDGLDRPHRPSTGCSCTTCGYRAGSSPSPSPPRPARRPRHRR